MSFSNLNLPMLKQLTFYYDLVLIFHFDCFQYCCTPVRLIHSITLWKTLNFFCLVIDCQQQKFRVWIQASFLDQTQICCDLDVPSTLPIEQTYSVMVEGATLNCSLLESALLSGKLKINYVLSAIKIFFNAGLP